MSNAHNIVLDNLNSKIIYGYEDQKTLLFEIIVQTVTTGGSNSVLLLGPRGAGKTSLVETVLQKAKKESEVFKKDGLIVKLHGLVETDDKLALKQIARQLKLENVGDGDRVFGSFAEHLEFLLSSLRSGDRDSKPVVFVLEEFHLFCSHHNQTLLYNLFDVAQSKATPMVVIGISPELDVLESLEKRVRSRFNHRQIDMFPPNDFKEYLKVAQDILSPNNAGKPWLSHVKEMFKSNDFQKTLEKIFNVNCSIAYLKQILSLALISSKEILTMDDIKEVHEEQNQSGDIPILSGLTLIETCLLISIKHILIIYDGQPFNFEMVHHEYDKFVSTKARGFKQDRTVVMKAWETLIELEIITPIDRGTKIQKEFKLYSLQVLPETILQTLDGIPQNVKEWATAGSYA